MIWAYIGIGLTIFFGGLGLGVPIGMWIGNMQAGQRQLRREVDELRKQVINAQTLQKSVTDTHLTSPAMRLAESIRELMDVERRDNND